MGGINSKTLVYSCSGCSSAAQLANRIAVRLDRTGKAEMSCIAGVGGDVPSLVRVARSGRKILSLDGCPLQCVQHCLKRQGVEPTHQVTLSDFDIKKKLHQDATDEDFERCYREISALLSV